MKFRKPEWVPLLFIVAAVGVLASLGFWQVERLQWKEGLLASIAEAQSQPAFQKLPASLDDLQYRKVALQGTFLHGKSLRRAGSLPGVGPGFFVLTPFKLNDNRIIVVNRGFAPEGRESMPQGMQIVQGVLRPPHARRPFTPDNQPEKNLWFHEDIAAMSQVTELALLALVVEATGTREREVYPMPSDGRISLRNDHLGYAITWFSLALVALVMFAFYHRIKE